MVCEKSPDCTKDMEKEGIDLAVDGDNISAVGTTLGADDGIAVAMILALLDSDNKKAARRGSLYNGRGNGYGRRKKH